MKKPAIFRKLMDTGFFASWFLSVEGNQCGREKYDIQILQAIAEGVLHYEMVNHF